MIEARLTAAEIAEWLLAQPGLPLAYSSADPAEVARVQDRFGPPTAQPPRWKNMFAEIARRLVAGGITRLITAGGETSGAVVEGLALDALGIGPEIDPGRCPCAARALRSGGGAEIG